MIPQLAKTFGVSALGVSDILGTYYYTYSTASLVAGVLLDRLGAKYVVSIGMAILGVGCLLFMIPQEGIGYLGRLLQGAGSAFAVLPAQNASGNWIKIVQRVPVRIALDQAELKDNPLRVGLSVSADVDVTDQSGPRVAGSPVTGVMRVVE